MHVVIDARLAGQRAGGIATYALELVAALAREASEFRLTVLRHRHAGRLSLPATMSQRRTLTPAHHRWEGIAFGLEACVSRPTLLHAPDVVPPAARAWPVVITVHDLAYLYWPEILDEDGRRYYRQIHQAVANADHIIAVSATTRRDLVDLLAVPPTGISVVPHAASAAFRSLTPSALPAAVVAASARPSVTALTLGEQGPYFLLVGTIEPRKNVPMLLKAYDALVAAWADAPRLVLAGREGWLATETWQVLSRLDARDRVTWIDSPSVGELALLYAAALALVFPSRYEGFGLPALEAMACGTPVIASDGSALREIVADAGWLVPPGDGPAWTEALLQIGRDRQARAGLAAAGLRRAAAYSWANTAAATLDVYRSVLAGA